MKLIQKPSPNFDARRGNVRVLVMHATATPNLEETFRYLIHSRPPHRVSAHYVIDRDGAVYQLVDESLRAWHAGVAAWGDITEDMNSRSIGIEFQCPVVAPDTLGDFTEEQIKSGLELCRDIVKRHRIPRSNVVAHSDIAPQRKKDPGPLFPWERFVQANLALRHRRPFARRARKG